MAAFKTFYMPFANIYPSTKILLIYTKELRDMASKPEDEHAYILDSFEEFEALARRALHEGIHILILQRLN